MQMALRRLQRKWRKSPLFLFFAVLGPGIIAAFGGNDASGIYGYSLLGAQYGYHLLWILLLAAISLGVCQEMGARMGAVTGKGLADLIREEYGVRVTLFAMSALLIANFATTISEFAGIAAASEIFAPGWGRWATIPLAATGVWLLVTWGTYKRVERILLSASLVYLAYIASAFMAHPPWGRVFQNLVRPDFRAAQPLTPFIFMIINVVGTTITPWAQFYIQSSVRDRATKAENYTPMDAHVGAVCAILVAFFIAVCCAATLYVPGVVPDFSDAGKVAQALKPVAGSLASLLFAIGLLNASCFGAITVPLSTAYAITESLGWESGINRRIREAPLFVGVFTSLIVVSAAVALLGGNHLAFLIILPNIIGALLLPVVLILSLKMINDRRLMGRHVNSSTQNLIAYSVTAGLIFLSAALIFQEIVLPLLHR